MLVYTGTSESGTMPQYLPPARYTLKPAQSPFEKAKHGNQSGQLCVQFYKEELAL